MLEQDLFIIDHPTYIAGVQAFEDGKYATAMDQLTMFITGSTGHHQAEGYALRAVACYEHQGFRARRTILNDLDSANELNQDGINILVMNLWLRGRMGDPIGFLRALWGSVKARDKYV